MSTTKDDGRAGQSCGLNKGVDLADRLAGDTSSTLTGDPHYLAD